MSITIHKKHYVLLTSIITFIYSIPFLLSPYDFVDDMYRASNGDLFVWFLNVRPFSVWLIRLLNGSAIVPDPYPFSFIIAFLALNLIFLYTTDKIIRSENYLLKLTIFIFLLCNPFFLQNLSYKYDCIIMTCSVALACLFVFKENNQNVCIDYIIRSCLIFSLYCFYQCALTLVIGLLAVKLLNDSDQVAFSGLFRELFLRLCNILTTFFIYKICVVNFLITNDYGPLGKIIVLNEHIFIHLIENIKIYLLLFLLYIQENYIIVSLIISSVFFLYTVIIDFLKKNYKRICVLCLCFPLLLVAITSSNIILNIPSGNTREMMGISAFFIFIFLYVQKAGCHSKIMLLVPICYLWTSLLLSSALCNLKRIDHQKNALIVQEILQSIYHFGNKKVEGITFIRDDLRFSSQQTIMKTHPLTRKIFDFVGLSNPWYVNGLLNGEYYMHKNVIGRASPDFPKDAKDIFSGCYIQSTLYGVILYVKTGSYCDSITKNYNPGTF